MATGVQRIVRRALLARLKADAPLLTYVAAASINPAAQPTWPFIILRSPVTQRLRAACLNGGLVTWDIHAFARPRESGGQMIDTAEDHAGKIGAEIERVLADNRLSLEGGGTAKIELSDIRLLPDAESDAYHWFAQINARVLAA